MVHRVTPMQSLGANALQTVRGSESQNSVEHRGCPCTDYSQSIGTQMRWRDLKIPEVNL